MLLSRRNRKADAKLAALDRAQGVIEFDLAGTIVAANETFLRVVGYALPEVVGNHHRMFVDPAEHAGPDYAAFWERLRRGDVQTAQFRRVAKGGREIWIEASYTPLLGRDGAPCGVVKFATDITGQKTQDMDRAGQIAAIDRSQAVIAFDLDGRILQANENFLAVTGYGLPEIVGQHHRMFVDPPERDGAAYGAFWAALRRGEPQAAQYRRLGKGGREIWIQASYAPILDAFGKPYKVVKFATDITDQVRMLGDLRRMIDQNFVEIDGAVERSSAAADAARGAAGSTTASVQGMAAAAEELATSVGEMSRSMTRSQEATEQAFVQVQGADGHTKRLADATGAMTGIVGMIQTIAAQINLLALNATIEAARAGEAGRGFAVVAQEVKVLADQAARATDQINEEINRVQGVSQDVVGALGAIRDSVGVMRGHIVSTAGAIDRQDAVTRDLARTMTHVVGAVAEIVGDIDRIGGAVAQVSGAVATTREAARVLAR